MKTKRIRAIQKAIKKEMLKHPQKYLEWRKCAILLYQKKLQRDEQKMQNAK